jgi:hypothetical protein
MTLRDGGDHGYTNFIIVLFSSTVSFLVSFLFCSIHHSISLLEGFVSFERAQRAATFCVNYTVGRTRSAVGYASF